ncbi:hypothetical protein ACC810_38555, partial [Rhizobium ruizarguesonis]
MAWYLLAPVLWNSNVAVFAMICGNVREPSVAACTTPDPTVYSGLASASQIQPNTEDKTGRVP